jgi:O-antigen/teichoic acid export membrane protein
MSEASVDVPEASTPRVIASNTAWRLVAFAARTVGGLAATILVARTEGPKAFGEYQFALTVTLLLSFLVMLGLPKLLVRELARDPRATVPWVESATFVSLLIGGALTAVLFGVSQVLAPGTTSVLLTVGGLALTADAAAKVVMAEFWASERMRYEAWTVAVQEAVFVAGTVVALTRGYGVVGVMVAYLISRSAGLWTAWAITAKKLGVWVWPRPHRSALGSMLRKTRAFAADDALSLAYIRLDAVLLGVIKGPTAVGLYQSATNLVLYLNILPRMLNLSLYPRMSRAWPDRPEEFGNLRDASLRLLAAVAMPITVGSLLVALQIFELVYGESFGRAALCYQLLVPVIPIRMLGHTLGTALTSADRQTQRTIAVGIAAGVNVALNAVMIPLWSFFGAAVATLITETGLFIGYAILLRRTTATPTRVVSAMAIPALACVPLAVVVVALSWAPLAIVVPAAVAVYLIGLFGIAMVMMSERPVRPRAVLATFLQGLQ